jgi:hypothetical protein
VIRGPHHHVSRSITNGDKVERFCEVFCRIGFIATDFYDASLLIGARLYDTNYRFRVSRLDA